MSDRDSALSFLAIFAVAFVGFLLVLKFARPEAPTSEGEPWPAWESVDTPPGTWCSSRTRVPSRWILYIDGSSGAGAVTFVSDPEGAWRSE